MALTKNWPGGGALTERWRKPLAKIADWVPVDFLLAWIDVESNGKPETISTLGERGLFQVHPDEKDVLRLSDIDFQDLTSNLALALKTGVLQAKTFAYYTKRFLADVGAEWHGRDFWKLVKLHHGAFAMPKYTLLAFQQEFGRGPSDWEELQNFALDAVARNKDLIPSDKKFSTKLRALIPKTFANAEKTGERSELPIYNPGLIGSVVNALRAFNLMV